jgi:hypothetical protein
MLHDKIAGIWARVQQSLLPHLESTVSEPLTERLYDLIVLLEFLRVEEVLRRVDQHGSVGAPPADRAPLLRAFLAKSVLKIPTNTGLYDRLRVDGALRRLCGWEAPPPPPRAPQVGRSQTGAVVRATRRGKRRHAKHGVPSEATFSRAFAEFADAHVLDLVHAQRAQEYMGDDVWEHGAYDGTAISAFERPAPKPPKPKAAPKPRGRRKKGDPRPVPPPPPPTRVQQQRQQTDLAKILAELPTACDKGGKKNSKGDTEWWNGYKMHLVTVEGDIPVAAITTSASMHDSGAAIPLMRLAAQRGVRILYDLMDAAYDAEEIRAESAELGHVPIIDANIRSATLKAERERLAGLEFSRLDVERALVDPDRRRRFKARTAAERVNSRLKEDPGVRLVRLRGHAKVHALLMTGVLVVFAKALLCM